MRDGLRRHSARGSAATGVGVGSKRRIGMGIRNSSRSATVAIGITGMP